MRRDKMWWSRGLGAVLLVPLLLWLSGCWLFQIPPTASFTVSVALIEVGGTINFSAIRSEDEDGTIVSYEWDFGDGTDGTGRSVAHTYTALGTFTVVLRVTDDDGLSATTQRDIYVEEGEPAGPRASFTASPTTGGSPLAVYFDASASSYTVGPLIYTWDFGDGSTGYGKTTSHLYVTSAGGTYTVTLRITAPDGEVGTTTGTVTVSGPGTAPAPSGSPSASFDITFPDTNDDVAPLRALFDPENSDPDTGRVLVTYAWSFGDGTSASTGAADIQEHVFITDLTSEIYSVTLVVIDDEGATDDVTKTVKVENYLPTAGFEVSDEAHVLAGTKPNPDVAAEWWTGEEDADGDDDRITYRDVPVGGVTVWIRSQEIVDPEWLDEDNDDPVPNAKSDEPGRFDDGDGPNMCFDPEGQTWEDGDTPPAWFPNKAWGIRWIRVNWGDGTTEILPYIEPNNNGSNNDSEFAADHEYNFTGDVKHWDITVTAIDFLGGEDSFSRRITMNDS